MRGLVVVFLGVGEGRGGEVVMREGKVWIGWDGLRDGDGNLLRGNM